MRFNEQTSRQTYSLLINSEEGKDENVEHAFFTSSCLLENVRICVRLLERMFYSVKQLLLNTIREANEE